MERVRQLAAHLTGKSNILQNHSDDIVITMAIRSPLCKANKGAFKDARQVYNLVNNQGAGSTPSQN